MEEIWKTIEDYPNYMVSNMGRVKSLCYGKEKIMKLCKASHAPPAEYQALSCHRSHFQ